MRACSCVRLHCSSSSSSSVDDSSLHFYLRRINPWSHTAAVCEDASVSAPRPLPSASIATASQLGSGFDTLSSDVLNQGDFKRLNPKISDGQQEEVFTRHNTSHLMSSFSISLSLFSLLNQQRCELAVNEKTFTIIHSNFPKRRPSCLFPVIQKRVQSERGLFFFNLFNG